MFVVAVVMPRPRVVTSAPSPHFLSAETIVLAALESYFPQGQENGRARSSPERMKCIQLHGAQQPGPLIVEPTGSYRSLMKTQRTIGSTVDSQPSSLDSTGRRWRPRDLWLISALAATTCAAFLLTGLAAFALCAVAVTAVVAKRSPGAPVVTVLAVLTVCLAALPLAMTVLSRLPVERRFQECMGQSDVSQCRDPLTSWLH